MIFRKDLNRAPPLSLHDQLRPIYVLSGAKVRISELNTKEMPDFLFISERKYFRPEVKGTIKRENEKGRIFYYSIIFFKEKTSLTSPIVFNILIIKSVGW